MNDPQAQPQRLRVSDGEVADGQRGGTPLDRRSLIAMAGGAALASFGMNQSAVAEAVAKPSADLKRVDAYTHFSSNRFLDFAEQQEGKPLVMRPQYALLKTLTDWKERLNLLDRNEIDVHVLVPVPWLEAFPSIANDRKLAVEAARLMNDELAAFVSEQPKRFRGVAILPTVDPDAMVSELHRAIKELGFIGAYLAVGPTAKRTDHPDMDALYKSITELDVTLWLHPSRPPMPEYLDEKVSKFVDWQALGWLHDTSSAMYRIVFAAVFDRYPGIRIVTHHAGGMLPTSAMRADALWNLWEAGVAALPTKVSKPYLNHFKNFYCDTAAFGFAPKVLEVALDFFGSEHVLFGSDTPFDVTQGQYFTTETLRSIEAMAISTDVRTAILSKNAARVLRLG
jgi:uncharacterized protein